MRGHQTPERDDLMADVNGTAGCQCNRQQAMTARSQVLSLSEGVESRADRRSCGARAQLISRRVYGLVRMIPEGTGTSILAKEKQHKLGRRFDVLCRCKRHLAQAGSSSRYFIGIDDMGDGAGEGGYLFSAHSRRNFNQPGFHEAVHRGRQLGIYFGPINFVS